MPKESDSVILQTYSFHLHVGKLSLFLLQKEIHDLKVQLSSTAEKEQDYFNQLLALKTDLEQEAYDHSEN